MAPALSVLLYATAHEAGKKAGKGGKRRRRQELSRAVVGDESSEDEVERTEDSENEEDGEGLDSFPLVYGLQVLATTLPAHPLRYARTLVQLGHEAIPPRAGMTFAGSPALYFPSLLSYATHIRRRDGVLGLYRGYSYTVSDYLLSSLVNDWAFFKINKFIHSLHATESGEADTTHSHLAIFESPIDDISLGEITQRFTADLARECGARAAAIIVTHPVNVMATRCFAQFVGGETVYDSWRSAVLEIYRNEGIKGKSCGVFCNGVDRYWRRGSGFSV